MAMDFWTWCTGAGRRGTIRRAARASGNGFEVMGCCMALLDHARGESHHKVNPEGLFTTTIADLCDDYETPEEVVRRAVAVLVEKGWAKVTGGDPLTVDADVDLGVRVVNYLEYNVAKGSPADRKRRERHAEKKVANSRGESRSVTTRHNSSQLVPTATATATATSSSHSEGRTRRTVVDILTPLVGETEALNFVNQAQFAAWDDDVLLAAANDTARDVEDAERKGRKIRSVNAVMRSKCARYQSTGIPKPEPSPEDAIQDDALARLRKWKEDRAVDVEGAKQREQSCQRWHGESVVIVPAADLLGVGA